MNSSLEVALSGMRAAMVGLDVTSHNVANVNTEGYTRQRVNQVARKALLTTVGLKGAGTDVKSVERVTDRFVARQIRMNLGEKGYYEGLTARLGEVETILNESLDGGLADAFNEFFSGMSQVSASPENRGTRVTTINSATLLASKLRSVRERLHSVEAENHRELDYAVTEFNTELDRLAQINGKIASGVSTDGNVSDLQDERDRVLSRIGSLLDVSTTIEGNDGQAAVSINGQAVVLGAAAVHLQINSSGLFLTGSTTPLTVTSGEIAAKMDLRDDILPQFKGDIDTLAATMITQFNAVHSANYGLDGSTGLDFFTGSDAQDIAVNTVLTGDPAKLAASGTGSPGDNAGAEALLGLREAGVLSGATFEEWHQQIVGGIGAEMQSADGHMTSIDAVLTQLYNRRDSVQGVSIDEEMANLIRFQQAYNASARIVAMIDELTTTTLQLGR
ncbi:MAG: flagellar hook-associated protein FlgK [Fimbriimonadaceae bacterium]|nr:flagellar hook-associated protein FlgK [Fimbriimonadaceae bacterium]